MKSILQRAEIVKKNDGIGNSVRILDASEEVQEADTRQIHLHAYLKKNPNASGGSSDRPSQDHKQDNPEEREDWAEGSR